MQNIFNFFSRFHLFFLFLFIEIFCFYLIIKQNFYQKSVFFNSTNIITANLYNTITSIKDYFYLKEYNRQLVEENAKLKSFHKSNFFFDKREMFIFNDTLYNRIFTYIPAKVINNTIHRHNNYLTLNVGARDGVMPGMGVVSPMGVVGIVKEVSDNFSTVYSMLHSKTKISGKIGRNEIVGTIIWTGKNYRKAEMKDIARFHNIHTGDTIYTSSFSRIFPSDIPIGYITLFKTNPHHDFYEIEIEIANDFSRVSDVYVIFAHKSEEQIKLEESTQYE